MPGELARARSSSGIDVLLSARRVGPTRKARGLDMTDGMLVMARENQRKAGFTNVEFLKGEIERIPGRAIRWTSSSPTASSTFPAIRPPWGHERPANQEA